MRRQDDESGESLHVLLRPETPLARGQPHKQGRAQAHRQRGAESHFELSHGSMWNAAEPEGPIAADGHRSHVYARVYEHDPHCTN